MSIDEWASRIAHISESKGFTPPSLENLPEKLMLSVSELSEALEEHRSDKPLLYFVCQKCDTQFHSMMPPDKCCGLPVKPEGIAVEIMDSIIRNLHMMRCLLEEKPIPITHGQYATIEDIIGIKTLFNAMRPEKHGRNY